MLMDEASQHLVIPFSAPRIFPHFSQIDEWTFSRSAGWNGQVQRKHVRLQGWPSTRDLNVGPFLAHHRTRRLEWKLIPPARRIKSAKAGHCFCASNFVGVCHPPDVSDDVGILNRNEKRAIRAHYQQKNLSQKEGLSKLESEILKFMESSDKPFSFPTKSELLKAGRADLVDAILATGGWLIAGWDVELPGAEKVETRTASGTESISKEIPREFVEPLKPLTSGENSMYKAMLRTGGNTQNRSIVSSGFQEPEPSYPVPAAKIQEEEALNLSNIGKKTVVSMSSGEFPRSGDLRRGWEEVSKLFGLSSCKRKPEHDRKSVVEDSPGRIEKGAYISTCVLKANTSVPADNPSIHLPKNVPASFLGKTDIPLSKQNYISENFAHGGNQSIDMVSQVKRRKKEKRRKFWEDRSEDAKVNEAFKQINEKLARRNDWVMMVKSRSHEKSYGRQNEDNPVSISSLIHCLEFELTTTLNMLQTERRLLSQSDPIKQMDNSRLSEFGKVSDALEFCETELMRKRGELRTTRAQLAALKGKLALELMESQKEMEEKDQRLNKAMNILKLMRTVRIVWPNPASEVFLAGSFDGWTSRIKLEKSNAGVFVTALQLYPGQYEVKFIVDGIWRVDPDRPIIHHDGFENNVLTILRKVCVTAYLKVLSQRSKMDIWENFDTGQRHMTILKYSKDTFWIALYIFAGITTETVTQILDI